MKRCIVLPILAALTIPFSHVFSQEVKSAALFETVYQSQTNAYETQYSILCTFSAPVDSALALDVRSWKVLGSNSPLKIVGMSWTKLSPTIVELVGSFADQDKITVQFGGTTAVLVRVDSSTVGKTRWGFGKGKALDLNVRRLTNQSSLLAFDYNFSTKILEHNLSTPNGPLWFRSASLDIVSNGTFGNDDTVRNGTRTQLRVSTNPFYFVGGLVYGGRLSVSYQLETKMSATANRLFEVANRSFNLSAQAEIPGSNYPMFALHSVTGYARLAMPIILSVEFLPAGKDANSNTTNARWDYGAQYELAFSPYLILQGEWRGTSFNNPPAGLGKTASYYSLAIAQDLDVVKESLSFLKLILGSDQSVQGKHFVFYRISSGQKAPAFENMSEQSFGVGTYF
ncbi:MAG: hypothetical protein Q8P51_01280 [Ignavibacteria bacterium]|nr:hypothetical protein [Ignavibacteria bacterium]